MSKAAIAPILRFKGMNNILVAGALAIISVIALLNSESIRAQINNLYSESNDRVAGITSLMTAVAGGDLEGVKFFSKGGAAMINQRNFGGATALHIASREDNLEIATILIENGADVNIADNEGWTPLMRAAKVKSAGLVNLLLDKEANAAAFNSINESAIIHAASSDCSDCLVAIFDKFNFVKNMEATVLKQQINDAYVIARNHENEEMQKILGDYLERVSKMNSLLEPQEVNLDKALDSKPSEINHISSAQSNKSGKKFKFVGESRNKVDSVEAVDSISIKKAEVAIITESAPIEPKLIESDLKNKKVIYKFLGQSGSSIAVQNYQAKVKGLLQNKDSEKVAKAEVVEESKKTDSSKKSYKFLGQSAASVDVKN